MQLHKVHVINNAMLCKFKNSRWKWHIFAGGSSIGSSTATRVVKKVRRTFCSDVAPSRDGMHLNMLTVHLDFVMNDNNSELLLTRHFFHLLSDNSAIFKYLIGQGVNKMLTDKFFGVEELEMNANLHAFPHGQLPSGCHFAKKMRQKNEHPPKNSDAQANINSRTMSCYQLLLQILIYMMVYFL